MSKNSLLEKSITRFKKNTVSLIFISVFFCLVTCVCIALDYIVSGASFIALFFLAIPMFFGAIVQSYALKYNQDLRIGTYFKYSYSYYRPQFYGCFHVLTSFLKSLLIELIVAILACTSLYMVFSNKFGAEFIDAFDAMCSYINAGMEDLDYLQEILGMNNAVLSNYIDISFTISSSFGVLAFIYFVSFNAIEAMFRSTIPPNMAAVGPRAFASSIRLNKKKLLKEFWSLNWPIFVLALLGLVGGVLLSIFGLQSYEYALLFGCVGIFIFIIPYFPIYLCNIHTIFENNQLIIINGIQQSVTNMLNKLMNNPNISEEQKAEANRIINDMLNKNNNDNNKKDPDSGS